MAKSRRIQQVFAMAIALTMAIPLVAFAADGKKHFKDGLKYEENRQWDNAAREFALAVAEKPANVEYQLHLQRALLSASIMLTERGDSLADKKDYNAAYNAYRQAYSFDPSNELALIKMRRMLEAQGLPTNDLPSSGDPAGPKIKPEGSLNQKASYVPGKGVTPMSLGMKVQFPAIPGKRFAKTDVIYRDTNILTAIEQLAQMMKLNVIFDQMVTNQMRMLKITVELRDVTYPQALEWILKTNNLMYAQIGPRTIVIAGDNVQARTKYEPYAVRTFYVKNTTVDDAKSAIQGALQTKAGIQSIKQLNALIVRDTPSNLELIENLINSIDKSKAEVLIDVNIYEVTRDDLLKLGNQFNIPGSSQDPANTPPLGGIGMENLVLGNGPRTLLGPFGFALGLPTSTISFFQDKGKAKLLASTQVHVIDNEANAVRIGQRVPIQTASFFPTGFVNTTGQQNNNQPNNLNNQFVGGGFGGGAFPQIQYENVGLNIDVTPNVYEDEVQMKMKIESSSVDNPNSLTPIFSQRTMSSVARIKDGQTALIAGVSQNTEAKSVRGIPLIGLIPILGRFFSTPSTTNRQSDVIITVTPHILRRADITERDHLAWAAGDQQNPSNVLKIDQILYIADQEDAQTNQVAEATPPAAEKIQPVSSPPPQSVSNRPESSGVVVTSPPVSQSQTKPNIIKQTVSRPGAPPTNPAGNPVANPQQQTKKVLDDDDDDDDDDEPANQNKPSTVMVYVRPTSPVATRGQVFYVAIFVNGNGDVSSAHISMSYDPALLEVRGVRDSGMMSAGARAEPQYTAEGGVLNIQMDRPQGTPGVPARGQLCLVEFTVKAPGQSPLVLNEAQTIFRNSAGQQLPIQVNSSQVEVR